MIRTAALITQFSRWQKITGIVTAVTIVGSAAAIALLPRGMIHWQGILAVVALSLLFTTLYYGTPLRDNKRLLLVPDTFFAGAITAGLYFLGPYAPYFFYLYFVDLAMDAALYDLAGYRAVVGIIMVALGVGHLINPYLSDLTGLALMLVEWLAIILIGTIFWLYASEAATERTQRVHAEKEAKRFAELERLKSDFLALASHEMRTPLGHIKGFVDVLRRKRDPVALERIDANADRLLRLIAQMLTVMKFETEGGKLQTSPLSLTSLVEKLVGDFRSRAAEKNITIEASIADAGVMLQGNLTELQEALTNLLENAIHYTPAGGTVVVRLRVSGGYAILTISDTGIGIPTDDLPHIFEKFFRASNARSQYPSGSGLGLYLTKRVIDQHRGTIDITSHEGKGTTMTISLPFTPQSSPEGSQAGP